MGSYVLQELLIDTSYQNIHNINTNEGSNKTQQRCETQPPSYISGKDEKDAVSKRMEFAIATKQESIMHIARV
jgi:hypothetical protein